MFLLLNSLLAAKRDRAQPDALSVFSGASISFSSTQSNSDFTFLSPPPSPTSIPLLSSSSFSSTSFVSIDPVQQEFSIYCGTVLIGQLTQGEYTLSDIFSSFSIPQHLRLLIGCRAYECSSQKVSIFDTVYVVGKLVGGSTPASIAAHHIDDTINKDAPSAVDYKDSDSSTTSSGTTTFIDNAGVTVGTARSNINLAAVGPPQFDSNAIADFLAKPTILWSGPFNISGAANDNLFQTSVASALRSNSIWMNKIQGYNLFRGTAVFKLTANATPFQQGRLIMHFLPNILSSDTVLLGMHNSSLTAKSNHPHVELGMRETSCEFRIPYITPSSYYSFHDGRFDWGTLYLDILSPLKVGAAASTSVDLTLFMSFEDVSLSAPYYDESGLLGGMRYVPQSGQGKLSLKLPKGLTLSRQQDGESKSDNEGFVSKAVHSAKKVTNFLSKVPVVGGIADTVGGALDTFGDVASFFGFQRPVDLDKTQTIITNPYHNQFNCVGRDMADRLSLNPDSHLENIKGWSGVDSDEMSFNFLKGLPTYTGSFTISTTDVADTLLYSETVSPMEQFFQVTEAGTVASTRINTYGPLAYLGQYFQFWRGSMTYTFKFVKTEFHSCRLALIFAPVPYATSITNSQGDFCIRTIIDLRTDSEITVTVPWLLNIPYQPVHDPLDDPRAIQSGQLFVRILNPLQAPESCAQNIEVLVYQSAGPDFEYAGLISGYNAPVFVPEAGSTTVSDLMANSPPGDTSNTHNLSVFGDPFVSIKQLLSMYCRMEMTFDLPPIQFEIYPYALMYSIVQRNVSTNINNPAFGRDYFSDLSLGYSLSRGGVSLNLESFDPKYKFTSAFLTPVARAAPGAMILGDPFNSQHPFDNGSSGYIQAGNVSPIVPSFTGPMAVSHQDRATLDVTIPHGCATPVRINRPIFANIGDRLSVASTSSPDQPQYSLLVQRNVNSTSGGNMYRRGADDYCLGYFIGFPRVLIASTPVA